MTKRLTSKHKVDRRLKVNLWGRPKSPFNSRNYPPGQHGKAKKGKLSDYGTQLEAKQKMKFYYGNINERQFRNVYRKAIQKKGNTTENLVGFLESRLDTVVYRAKFATTVFSARQLINHGHIKVNLWGRPKSPFNSRNYPPGQHGKAKKGKLSDYGAQLEAKQKMKFYYGNMNERQFRNVYRKAIQKKGNTTENLVGFLERRLDTVAYRAKFATTVFSARQLINHGHIKINGKKVNIPSYLVKAEDSIEIKDKSKDIVAIVGALMNKEREVPDYIQVDEKNKKATLTRIPKFSEVPYPVIMEPNLVIEYYSR